MQYSPSTRGFYDKSINDNIPPDAVDVSQEQYQALMEAQSGGLEIRPGPDGQPVASEPTPPPAQQVTSVTMRQARLALLAAGKLDAVGAAIAALPSPQKDQAQIEWDYATTVERSSPFCQQMAQALGLDDAALDALFTQAAAL